MRIALVSDTYLPDINGVVSSIVTLQKELERMGHDVFVIANHKGSKVQRDGNILKLPGIELKWLYGYTMSSPFHIRIKNAIRDMHLDVMHIHTEFGVGMFGRMCAKSLNIPVVTTYHTMYEDYTHYFNVLDINEIEHVSKKVVSSFSKSISNQAQAVISPSEKTKETLLAYKVKTPIYVIPTGINLDKFNMDVLDPQKIQDIKNEYGIKPDEKLIVSVGRIAQEKSIDVLIDGFAHIKDPKIKFMIVGDGPQLEELKKKAKSLHVDDRMIFTGKKMRDEVPYYYACADCFVCASLSETQGMTFIEALASKLIVIARYDDVLKDLVIEDQTGYFFSTNEEFAQKVESYLALDDETKQKMRENAREKALSFDAKIFGSKVLSVYYQAIDDFADGYKVTKIKVLDNYAKIYVQNDSEDEPKKILITLDDYFTYKIRLHMMMDRYTIDELIDKERLIRAYETAIRKLKAKDYSYQDMHNFLLYHSDLLNDEVDTIMKALQKRGYIDDQRYVMDKMEQLQYSLTGKEKIKKTLLDKGIDAQLVENAFESYDEELEIHNAKTLANKLMLTIKNKSKSMKKKLIISKLINYGYDSSLAKESVEDLDFSNENEESALQKTIEKARRHYEKKYDGEQLQYRIVQYCIQKGFSKENILTQIEQMRWEENE